MAVETSWDKAYKLSEQNEGGISTDRDDTGNFYEVDGKNNFVATRYGQTFVNWLGSSKKKKPTKKFLRKKPLRERFEDTEESCDDSEGHELRAMQIYLAEMRIAVAVAMGEAENMNPEPLATQQEPESEPEPLDGDRWSTLPFE